ncbi:hypothetical protein [Pseudomonas sp. SCB32]|nr:hypothetical protein [Pseudomonas sp. SCB32]
MAAVLADGDNARRRRNVIFGVPELSDVGHLPASASGALLTYTHP